MKYRVRLSVLLLFSVVMFTQSQNVGKIKLEWNYSGTLYNVLKAIGDDYNLHFVYDTLKLEAIEVKYYAFEENTLSKLFQEWQKQWGLFTYPEKERTVLISDCPLTPKQRREQLNKQINNHTGQ